MSSVENHAQFERLVAYLKNLEKSHRALAIENAQVRGSHSYRLGNAFVRFAKEKKIRGLPRLFREIRESFLPHSESIRPLPKAPYIALTANLASDAFRKQTYLSPVGSEIDKQIGAETIKVVGAISGPLQSKLQGLIVDPALPFDRYDQHWAALRATHLIIEVEGLRDIPGWRHVLTLRDPSATVELATMLAQAKRAGIHTVLVEPAKAYRFPLLSRVHPLFDTVLSSQEVTEERLFSDTSRPT